jgi:hypothetical protein
MGWVVDAGAGDSVQQLARLRRAMLSARKAAAPRAKAAAPWTKARTGNRFVRRARTAELKVR